MNTIKKSLIRSLITPVFRRVLSSVSPPTAAEIIAFSAPPNVMRDKRFFSIWEKLGYHVTPVHFLEPIPPYKELLEATKRSNRTSWLSTWSNEILLPMLDIFAPYKAEYETFPETITSVTNQYHKANGYFHTIDACVLHSMIRHFKPKRIIEIGSGNSTYVSAQACLLNQRESGREVHLTAIEPFPNEILKQGFAGLSELIVERVQTLPHSMFEMLEENDILFVDSTHVLRTGGDVQYIYLEILPRLRKGVLVHIHDIFLPDEYPSEWMLDSHVFLTEQYLLQAFLLFNSAYEVIWATHNMLTQHKELVESTLDKATRIDGHAYPSSFWMRKTQ